MLQVVVTTVRVLPFEEDKVPKDGAVKVGQALAVQVGDIDHALMTLETTPLQVIELEPVSVKPVLHEAVTTVAVLPLAAETVPKDGAVKEGQALALHVGTVADHALAALATPLQVIELEPERV